MKIFPKCSQISPDSKNKTKQTVSLSLCIKIINICYIQSLATVGHYEEKLFHAGVINAEENADRCAAIWVCKDLQVCTGSGTCVSPSSTISSEKEGDSDPQCSEVPSLCKWRGYGELADVLLHKDTAPPSLPPGPSLAPIQ